MTSVVAMEVGELFNPRFWGLSILLCLTCLLLAGCGETTASLNQAAMESLNKGDSQAAESLLKKAAVLDPVNKTLIGNLVEVFFRGKKWDDAILVLEKTQIIEGLAGDRGLKTRLAEAYIMKGEPGKAFPVLSQLIKEGPEDEYLLFLHGFTSDSPDLAITSLTKAIQLKPDRKEAYLALVRAQAWAGDAEAARGTLKTCEEKLGTSKDLILYGMGLYLREGDTEMARKLLDTAPAEVKEAPVAKLFQAYLDLGDRKVPEARAAFETLEEAPDVAVRAKLGAALCMLMQDDPNLAIELCEEVVQANPKDVTAHNLMGLGQLKRLQKFLAKRSFETSLQINPDQPAIRALTERLASR